MFATFSAVASLMIACGSDEQSSGAVDEWLGEETHLAISGSFQGSTFDVNLQGDEAADLYCHRFYTPVVGAEPDATSGRYDTSDLYFTMTELGGVITLDGAPKEFAISFWRHDVAAGGELEVVPRTFGTSIPSGQTWSDINVFDPGTDVLSGVESAAESGSISMELNAGDADANGIYKAGGRTGAHFDVSWGPDDSLKVSATADCSPGIVVTWPQTRLLP